ncbi:hypothetical protein [Luteolibacter marinus]|uniref:hypothetical protein n=1 Tax=Luteolibacter marinus TaxID=2776705 RepID=UPI0018670544|nr:hypothetical protein [Luteolibacter marinus]
MRSALCLLAFLVGLDAAIVHWRNSASVSDAPVWSLPMAEAAMKDTAEASRFIKAYKADRGAEMGLRGGGGESVALFYYEWDKIRIGPASDIAGHEPEICNQAAGFKFLGAGKPRTYQYPGHGPLVFDVTRFSSPAGNVIHVYKAAWFQGLGSWNIRLSADRLARIRASFTQAEGAARVIEGGVSEVENESQAWRVFESTVLEEIEWQAGP